VPGVSQHDEIGYRPPPGTVHVAVHVVRMTRRCVGLEVPLVDLVEVRMELGGDGGKRQTCAREKSACALEAEGTTGPHRLHLRVALARVCHPSPLAHTSSQPILRATSVSLFASSSNPTMRCTSNLSS
jgi:hypothetical protein